MKFPRNVSMANMQVWQAFLVLDEAHWQFLGLSPWPDQLLRWCRKFVRGLAEHKSLRHAELVVYSRDDRPRVSKWRRDPRHLRHEDISHHGWQKRKVFQHPFDELLSKTDKTFSNGAVKAADRQSRERRAPTLTPSAGSGTAFDEPAPSTVAVEPECAKGNNDLLYWLSAAGAGRWDAFMRTCQVLGLAQDSREARRVSRRLILLGHLTSNDGLRWIMQPPTLSPLALEPERAILRGQRSATLLACLPENRGQIVQQGGPDRICTCVPLDEGVSMVSVGGICFRAERSVLARAQELPTWRGWMQSLKRFDRRDLGRFVRTERRDGTSWVGTPLYYDQPSERVIGASGMYRLKQETPSRSPRIVCFDAEEQILVCGDWYGLRFLAGRLEKAVWRGEWGQDQHRLFVPADERWPFLYEQVLVQASGLLPSRSERQGWLCYHGILKELVDCICGKLDVEIRPVVSAVRSAHHHAVT